MMEAPLTPTGKRKKSQRYCWVAAFLILLCSLVCAFSIATSNYILAASNALLVVINVYLFYLNRLIIKKLP